MDRQNQEGIMGTGKRTLVAVAIASLLTIAAAGCDDGLRVAGQVAKHAAKGMDEMIEANKSIPRPIKKALTKMAAHEAKDVIRAACHLKDSSNIEQQAYSDYADRGDYKLIASLAKVMQANPEARALCS